MWRRILHFGSLRGRASRAEYAWVFALWLGVSLAGLTAPRSSTGFVLALGATNWLLLYGLLAATVRRFHDFGRSAWLLLTWPIASFVLVAWCFVRPSRAA